MLYNKVYCQIYSPHSKLGISFDINPVILRRKSSPGDSLHCGGGGEAA